MADTQITEPKEAAMSTTVVHYRVKPDRAEENSELVRAVYGELATLRPPGLRYATYAEPDGVSFVHVAFHADDQGSSLTELPAFRRFQAGLGDRCEQPPAVTKLTDEIGSYGFSELTTAQA
jgi:hypothetical protein